jgi:hypothetical protein
MPATSFIHILWFTYLSSWRWRYNFHYMELTALLFGWLTFFETQMLHRPFRNQIWRYCAMLVAWRPVQMIWEISCYPLSKRLSVVPRKGFKATTSRVWNSSRADLTVQSFFSSSDIYSLWGFSLHRLCLHSAFNLL